MGRVAASRRGGRSRAGADRRCAPRGASGRAIVTGAGTGIGRVTALAYAREGAGVVLAARRIEPLEETAALVRSAGGACLVVAADVTREDDCTIIVARALDRFGRVDVLVNNAGSPGTDMRVAEMTLANWNDTLAANLTGPMLLTRETLHRAMLPARSGNVQFCSSLAARNVRPEKSHYAVANIPMRRAITPDEVAAVSLYLASEAASAITGKTIRVAAGR